MKDPLVAEDSSSQQIWVNDTYRQMSLGERVGQLFMVMAFSSGDETHCLNIERLVADHRIGGIIFSLGNPMQQAKMSNHLQEKATVPLLMGMDAERGIGTRLESVIPFPWNMALGAIQDTDLIREIGKRIGEQARRIGVHINFAPDVDINTNPKNPIIGNRSFGEDKYRVAQRGAAFVDGMHTAGVLSCAKHFPGHGDSALDSHKSLPKLAFSQERLVDIELYPFRELIEKGVSSVMIGHLDVAVLDDGMPSSISFPTITTLLKHTMGFEGLIVSDALDMKGVANYKHEENHDLLAFLAGNDIILMSTDVPLGIQKIAAAYKEGKISEDRLAHSVKTILKAKYKVGLHSYQPVLLEHLGEDLNTAADSSLYIRAMSSALTVIKNEQEIVPVAKEKKTALVQLGDGEKTLFQKTLTQYGDFDSIEAENAKGYVTKLIPYEQVIIGFHHLDEDPWSPYNMSDEQIAFVNEVVREIATAKRTVLIAFAKPYALQKLDGAISAASAVILSYQNDLATQEISAKAVLGLRGVSGRLPVTISEHFPAGLGIDIAAPS